MNQKVDVCKQCGFPRPVNSKLICPDCVFKNNHQGLNQQAVYYERHKLKEEQQPKVYINNLPNATKKAKKTMINGLLKDTRLEKRRNKIDADEIFYEKFFSMTEPQCEECGTELPDVFRDDNGMVVYRSQYSHILGKGAYPEFRHDLRNMNRLCLKCHHIWDFGDRTEMSIYYKNQETVQILRDEKNRRREEQSFS